MATTIQESCKNDPLSTLLMLKKRRKTTRVILDLMKDLLRQNVQRNLGKTKHGGILLMKTAVGGIMKNWLH
jgi:hypothetical protein